jgi:hypothetical protein
MVSFWDRTEDRREGSHAVFLCEGTLSEEELLKAAAEAFPKKWEQLVAAGGLEIGERT